MIDTHDDRSVLSIISDDGDETKYFIIAKYNVGERYYIALKPQHSDEDRVELFRCSDNGDGNVTIYNIMGDMEFSDAKREFERIVVNDLSDSVRLDYDERTVINVIDSEGTEHACEIVSTFTYMDNDYIALLPYDDAELPSIQLFSYLVTPVSENLSDLLLGEIPYSLYPIIKDHYIKKLYST